MDIPVLNPKSLHFPDVHKAIARRDGLVAVGGDLRIERLLAAYVQGIFPWYSDGQPICWWALSPRTVLYPHKLHIGRSLAKTLRNPPFPRRDCRLRRRAARRAGRHLDYPRNAESLYPLARSRPCAFV